MVAWKRTTVQVQAGEYKESTVERAGLVSADGRFTIRPTGHMVNKSRSGFRGTASYHFSWRGYKLFDSSSDVPTWRSREKFASTVRAAKRAAELITRSEQGGAR